MSMITNSLALDGCGVEPKMQARFTIFHKRFIRLLIVPQNAEASPSVPPGNSIQYDA